jgi:hypothetical protein
MSLSQNISLAVNNSALLEKVITASDLAGLSPIDKVNYIKNVCESLGLNPLTRPIQLIRFDGKEVMYFTKDSTEQLRKNNKVSINNIENTIFNGVYIVTAHASTPDGRIDASTGATSVDGLKGNALCVAMMKAETKAKRRVTLSICGLGHLDESEIDAIPNAKHVDIEKEVEAPIIESINLDDALLKIYQADTLDNLFEEYKHAYKVFSAKKDGDALKKVIFAKDARKKKIEEAMQADNIDIETGEVI